MKIIKEGSLEVPDKFPKRATHKYCGAEVEYEESDLKYYAGEDYGPYIEIKCPTCQKEFDPQPEGGFSSILWEKLSKQKGCCLFVMAIPVISYLIFLAVHFHVWG